MLSPMSPESKSPNLASLAGCIAIMINVLFLSNTCKGQEETSNSVSAFIVDGSPALKGRFPYMCSIRKRGSEVHACGGIVIDEKWIMTAAHCLDPSRQHSAGMSPTVYCSIYEREEQTTSKRFAPTRCYLHHLWDGNVFNGDDIALCQLERSASVDIPRLSNIEDGYSKSDNFSALGWGSTSSTSDFADVLLIRFPLAFYESSSCNFTEGWAGRIKDSMICAGRGTPNTCKGDSGGPLFLRHAPENRDKDEDPQFDLIVGITSFGDDDCEASLPSVYTRVSCYRPWIDCITKGTGEDCTIHKPCGESSLCSGVRTSATFDESDALERIRRAIVPDDYETVKTILCSGLSPHAVFGANKNSLLLRAAHYDAIESAKVLLQHGSRIEYKNSFGQAALSRAAGQGSLRVAQLLIDSGADIESKGDEGWTPLTYTASFNHPAVAKVLLMKGANIESKNIYGLSPLHLSMEGDSFEVAQLLVANGANIEVRSNLGDTPLILAAYFRASRCVQLLLDNNATVDAANNNGGTALFWAAASGRVTIVGVLLDKGASKAIADNDGKTPFDVICDPDHVDEPCNDAVLTTLRLLLEL